jgi:hypothetical protein
VVGVEPTLQKEHDFESRLFTDNPPVQLYQRLIEF